MVSTGRNSIICWYVEHMLPYTSIFSLYTFFVCSSLLYCSARDTIPFNSSISDERGETLVSAGEKFELGFFTPNESTSHRRYVGIWYYNSTPQTVVWVANRDRPVLDDSGVFTVTKDGNLTVLDGKGISYWSSKHESPSFKKATARLTDSGNLVLSDDVSTEILWESFRYPTDTFLPGMKMDAELNLTSWKSGDDPATGNFTFQRDQGEKQYIIWKTILLRYWRSEADQMPPAVTDLLSNFTGNFKLPINFSGGLASAACLPSPNPHDYINWRLVMDFNGEIRYLRWVAKKRWSIIWVAPRDRCGALNPCGNFGICNRNNWMGCKCLPGFEPMLPNNWKFGDFSGGCGRKSRTCGEGDTFLSLKMMKVKSPDKEFIVNETECREKLCLGNSNCNCMAYSYSFDKNTSGNVCSIWTDSLSDLEEEYADGGRNLFARTDLSDIVSTKRNCESCGTNLIPYPLSTGPNCGDPMYSSLYCNISTGQVSFKAPNGTYRVTSIDPKTQKIVIQVKGCVAKNSTSEILPLDQKLPFHVKNWCNAAGPGNSSSNSSSRGIDEVELSWDPPLEPTCTSSMDCKDWPADSSCNAARDGKKRCLCNENFRWNGSSLYCTRVEPSPRKTSLSLIILVASIIVIVLIALLCTTLYYLYLRRKSVAKLRENNKNVRRNQALHWYDSERRVKEFIDSDQFKEDDKTDIDVPFFDLKSILVATENFSEANKLGKGGFGPVYKGKFPGGREIAVKRLSSVSGQGLGEFKNEIVLIARLQHRNLVKLLGYCIQGEEKILLYEYMPNRSLDSFIFDKSLCAALEWELRFNIILGIARGLLYLHQDSRLRIIHRDLKTSNILLDGEMNPKISDFGLAKIFGGKQNEANTNRIVGTYGYMSPEYALEGVFSDKSDVFSFGVVVLEIISGKRNTRLYQYEQVLSLLGYAWRLWNEDNALDLMDQSLRETCNTNEFMKCVNVGLLCVQEDPSDRPTMSNVVFMLGSETATLPTPNQPAFIVQRGPSSTASTSSRVETCSNNEITITLEEGR